MSVKESTDYFDRKTFDPVNRCQDAQRLRALRAVGGSRLSPSTALANLRLPEAKNGMRFIDVGCGDSRDALLASKRGYWSTGLDLFPPTNAIYPFIQADAVETWPIESDSAHAITCQAMIDLVVAAERILLYQEAYRVLVKTGAFSLLGQALRGGYGFKNLQEVERAREAGFRAVEVFPNGFVAVK